MIAPARAGVSPRRRKKVRVVAMTPRAQAAGRPGVERLPSPCHARASAISLREMKLDAIVIDLLMPEIDGFEFLDRVKNLANCRDTPVIVWTAKAITTEERVRLNNVASSIALKGQGGIDAVLRELRFHVAQRAEVAASELP